MKRRVLKTIIAILLINMLVIKISPIVYAVNGEVLEVSEKKNDSSSEEIDNEDEKEDNTDVEKREDNTDVEEIEDENDVEAIEDKKNVEEIDNIYQEYIETQNIIYKNEDEIKIREKNEQEINEEDVNDEAEIIEKTEKLEEKKLLNSNIISQVEVKKDEDEEVIDDTGNLGIAYKGFINNQGNSKWKLNDSLLGTENQGIDLNGLKIELTNEPTGAGIEYQVLEETTNGSKQWSSWKTNGELAGFEENNKKIYAIKIRLINMPNYSVEYRVHRRYQGWESQYVSDGEIAGTEYTDSRLEGIKIRIVPKISKSIGIKYKGYINNNGYQEYSKDDMLTGTENQGIDLNGLKIELTNAPTGTGIEYQVLEETTNGSKQWSSWKTNGELAGFEENNKKIYAIKIRLINMPNYSVEYRVHRRYQGWESQYVSDGEIAGTEYTDSRLEGIKIRIVPKIRKSIGVQYKGYVDNQGYQEWTNNGMLAGTENKGTGLNGLKIELTNAPSEVGIEYQVLKDGEHGKEWTSWLKNGEIAGFSQNERNIYAIKIRLSNTNSYSVKYRVHRQYQGWEYSWKWDGLMAGLENGSSRLEGIQITIVPKIQVRTGIDISQYQNIINWSEVRNSGINFSIIRVGYRGYGSGKIVYDPYFMMNIKGALLNGIDCGVYFYTQAINESEAIEEANWVINAVKPYNIVYPIVIDTEWSSENKNGRADWISTEQRTKYIQAFCRTIKEAGYNPMIYANKDWLENHLNMDELSEYSVWLAHYVTGAPDKKSDYQRPYVMWQYTSSGNVNGIEGNVDMDLYYY